MREREHPASFQTYTMPIVAWTSSFGKILMARLSRTPSASFLSITAMRQPTDVGNSSFSNSFQCICMYIYISVSVYVYIHPTVVPVRSHVREMDGVRGGGVCIRVCVWVGVHARARACVVVRVSNMKGVNLYTQWSSSH